MASRLHKPISRRELLRLTAGAAGASALAPLLAACGGTAPQPTTSGAAQQGEAVTISMMGWGSPLEKDNVDLGLQLFQSQNPGINVRWLHTPEDYETKLLTALAGGTPPDVFWANNVLDFVARGVVMDITDRLDLHPVLGDPDYFIQPQEFNRSTWNDRWYGIGSCWVLPHLYYNAELLEEAGVEPPPYDASQAWSWEQFLENARLLTLDASGRHPGETGFDPENIVQWGVSWPTWNALRDTAVFTNGGESYTKDLTIELGEPAAVEAIQALADLANVHHVAPQAAASEQLGMSTNQMLSTGRVALLVDGSWALQDISKLDFSFGCGVLPKMKVPVTPTFAHLHVIADTTEHPDAAWELLAFLSSDEYQRDLCKVGLWLPSHTTLLTEEGLASWITPGVHPEGYSQIATDYLVNYSKAYFYPAGFSAADQIITAALDPVWIGQQTAAEALTPEVIAQATEELREAATKLPK